MARIDEFLAPTVELRRLLHHDVDEGRDRLIRASNAQLQVLNLAKSQRRVEVVGPAGSGKSLVAVEKARRLAKEGWRTLFVCFNQALATAVLREFDDEAEAADRRPAVSTFHRLAETLATRAGLLGPKPANPGQDWFDGLAANLVPAIEALPDVRYDAIVIDEGQDFDADWLVGLELLLENPDDGILWVFHDPGQALFRDDVVAGLGLVAAGPVRGLPVASAGGRRWRPGSTGVRASRSRWPRAAGRRRSWRRRRARRPSRWFARRCTSCSSTKGVRPWQIVVLSGEIGVEERGLEAAAVRHRRAVERGDRRRRAVARAAGRGRARRAEGRRRGAVRDRAPVQGPRAAGRDPVRAARGGRSARPAPVHGLHARDDPPRRDRAAVAGPPGCSGASGDRALWPVAMSARQRNWPQSGCPPRPRRALLPGGHHRVPWRRVRRPSTRKRCLPGTAWCIGATSVTDKVARRFRMVRTTRTSSRAEEPRW